MIYLLQVPGGEPALYRQNHHMDGTCPNVGVRASKQAEAGRERMMIIPSCYIATATSNIHISYTYYVLPSATASKPASKQHSAEKHMQSPRVPHSNDSPDLGPWRNQGESSEYFLALHTPPPSLPPFTPHPHTHTAIILLSLL